VNRPGPHPRIEPVALQTLGNEKVAHRLANARVPHKLPPACVAAWGGGEGLRRPIRKVGSRCFEERRICQQIACRQG
jgi:hypothetical protein